jgi:hypothetical protein
MQRARTFSELHIAPGPRVDDCKVLRGRCGQFFRDWPEGLKVELALELSKRTGKELHSHHLAGLFNTLSLVEFRDSIVHVFNGLPEFYEWRSNSNGQKLAICPQIEWRLFVTQAFAEENSAYRVRDDGSVTYAVDSGLETVREAVIQGLGGERYSSAIQHVDDAMEALAKPGAERSAIRAIFDAVETVFRLEFKEGSLGTTELKRHEQKFAAAMPDDAARTATNLMVGSFSKWIAACHTNEPIR